MYSKTTTRFLNEKAIWACFIVQFILNSNSFIPDLIHNNCLNLYYFQIYTPANSSISWLTSSQQILQVNCEFQMEQKLSLNINSSNITNSVALSPQANYTDWAIATCLRNIVPTFVDKGVSCGQRGGTPTVVNLSFLDRSRYFSFK
jgi:hypothetical protein